jgi:2-polyprenyl-6-methoxyphenol hydroxylase-like FAD-dependent oxidoreductase
VTLLEAHPDFDREFRGDTLHPSVMEIMDQLGLADRLLQLRHSKVDRFTVQTDTGPFTPANLSRLKTKFPYITIMPQTSFLEFIVAEAEKYPSFRVVMGARVRELVEEAAWCAACATRTKTARTRCGRRSWSGPTGAGAGCGGSRG